MTSIGRTLSEVEKSELLLRPEVQKLAYDLVLEAMAKAVATDAFERYHKKGRLGKFVDRQLTKAKRWWEYSYQYRGWRNRLDQFTKKFLWPLRVAWVHSRLLAAQARGAWLEQQLKAAARGYVERVRVAPGDLLVFVTDRGAATGSSFGVGWAALQNLQAELSRTAGGPVSVMASATDSIRLATLNRGARDSLQAQLDKAEAGEKVPDFKLFPNGRR